MSAVKLFARTPVARPGGTQVRCQPGVITIESPAVFGQAHTRWQGFVDRLSQVSEVSTVEIDRRVGTAYVRFERAHLQSADVLDRLARALTPGNAPVPAARLTGLEDHLAGQRWIRLYRRGAGFSTWELVHELPGRIRVRDTTLRGRTELVRRLELELHTIPGVLTVAASATTGSVVIRFDPATIDREGVLAALDDTVCSSELLAGARAVPQRASFKLANATLVLATVGEFMFPAVLPVSAILLVATNLPAFRESWRELRGGRPGLGVLQTSIVAGTLVTGGFIASSLMSWLLLFWQNRHARQVATARQILGATVRKQHRTAWVLRDGVELETPASRLKIGDVISVRNGDMLPVDGKIISGTALVDETVVRGTTGLACRTIEQSVLRGTLIVDGDLRVEITRCGDNTVAECIGQALDAATQHTALSLKHAPPRIAKRAVSPVLLTAGVGLLVGDATTAVAIMRPDYVTGPGIGGALLLVDQMGACLQIGLVVRQARVFNEMAAVDMVLIDEHPALARRLSQLARVEASAELTADELLQYAEAALRGVCDSRSGALTAECAARGLAAFDLTVRLRNNDVELQDQGRRIRIEGLTRIGAHDPHDALSAAPAPLVVYCNERLAGTLTFCIGDQLAAVPALYRLRTDCGLQVGLLSPHADADQRARELGIDFQRQCTTDAAKAQFIEECRRDGHRVAFVGDCRLNPAAAAAANVAIAPVTEPVAEDDLADVWLMQADYGQLASFHEISRVSRRREQLHQGLTLIPNLTCVAGAFLFGFTSLAAVVISNLGTYSVYKQQVAALRRTERRLLSRQVPAARRRIPTATETV